MWGAGRICGHCLSSSATTQSDIPKHPVVEPAPFDSGRVMPYSPLRDRGRYCYVKPSCTEGRDDAPKVFGAFTECNGGGTHINVVITGEVHFATDPYYWVEQSFKCAFQNQSLGDEHVNIYGDLGNDKSVIDGHGQVYWGEISNEQEIKPHQILRPMLFSFEGVEGATMSHLRMRNPPNWSSLIANSTDVVISDMDLRAIAVNGVEIANSDGWDTYRSDRIVIQNSYIITRTVSQSFDSHLGPQSHGGLDNTNIVVQNVDCTGSHGMSVGSLGQYKDETDTFENVYVYNTSMADASDAARIKVWPGIETAFQTLLNDGGGLGRVRNVTDINNDRAITTTTQCYGQKNQTFCEEFPANLTISDITLKNICGTTSEKIDPQAGTLVCSAPERCNNIRAENVTVTVPSGKSPI
ncbi:pectin lyase fold/virulence factor [Colletotrichum navitas]|uniref:galacturonan 1,4-alpha-galacturonidase n=1 Tax=Colletotrichum navitas TaxID=681940 RepID=A0AAD8V090_9PEZI|nr:pectin lyase fold/virulence factor [Colletotrichum navitas]KAK1580040.1 pectin lyase fold/virulence factor [Colletotrichum navitas]